MITLVITSCGRIDLLERTLQSFIARAHYPMTKTIVVEDSANPDVYESCLQMNKRFANRIEFIFNECKLGQTKSIDLAYARVNTPYVFHCEDDWEFYRSGFIEASLSVLESRPEVLQGWIRPFNDGLVNRISPMVFRTSDGVPLRTLSPVNFRVVSAGGAQEQILNYWGFSFNPGLKRMNDYLLLGPGGYARLGREHLIDYFYRDLGYRIVSLSENDDDGYVRHIGRGRHVPNTVW